MCSTQTRISTRFMGRADVAGLTRRSGIEPLDADVQQHDCELRVLCFGRTKSGRLLTVLYTERRGKIRVVTAYEMTKRDQQS